MRVARINCYPLNWVGTWFVQGCVIIACVIMVCAMSYMIFIHKLATGDFGIGVRIPWGKWQVITPDQSISSGWQSDMGQNMNQVNRKYLRRSRSSSIVHTIWWVEENKSIVFNCFQCNIRYFCIQPVAQIGRNSLLIGMFLYSLHLVSFVLRTIKRHIG